MRRALFMPHSQPLFGAQAIDATLDLEQHVDAPDRLQRDRRDPRRVLAARALAAISASSKNCRLACAQHSADVIGPGKREGW